MKSYKSFSAGAAVSLAIGEAGTYSDGDKLYTVPSDCSQAKLTFVSINKVPAPGLYMTIGIKKGGAGNIIYLPSISILAFASGLDTGVNYAAVNLMELGLYLDPGDEIYPAVYKGSGSTTVYADYIYVSGMLEYDN